MALTNHNALQGADHFDPKEIMKVSEILHFEQCCEFRLDVVDFFQDSAVVKSVTMCGSRGRTVGVLD